MGLQFEGLVQYNSILAADFWRKVRDQYPHIEEHPPLDPIFETFGANDGAIPQPRIEFLQAVPQPRLFMVSQDGARLVQLQKDRLHFNWRSRATNEPYPRYPRIRGDFEQALAVHEEWAASLGGGLNPTQAEIAYVNRIPLLGENGLPCGLSAIFPWLAGLPGWTETGSFQFRRRLLDENDRPVARLHFGMQYGTDDRGMREAHVNFVVRGRPAEPTTANCLSMLDEARKIIVHTFTGMTSASAHRAWERQV